VRSIRWNGGPADSSDWDLTIGPDRAYSLVNDYIGLIDGSYVDTSNGLFEMYT